MTDKEHPYHPEPYWSEVAGRIAGREQGNVIAGDDEPYYRYKRRRFLEMLHSVDFSGKRVLEVGPGPGGNLIEVLKSGPAELYGADISQQMIELAARNVNDPAVKLVKTDGRRLPFDDGQFDIVFTSTVLQHNSDDAMMAALLSEICRVSRSMVVLFEKIDSTLSGDVLCRNRPVADYAAVCRRHGFELKEVENINIYASFLLAGFTRKALNPAGRREGEPLTALSLAVQRLALPLTKRLDKILKVEKDVAKMVFVRK